MAIIKKRQNRNSAENSAPSVEIKKEEPKQSEDTFVQVKKPEKESSSHSTLGTLVSITVGVLIVMIGYGFYSSNITLPTFNKDKSVQLQSDDISLSIEKLKKIGELASLTQKEYDGNFVSYTEAKSVADTQTIHALEIILNKNKHDLENYKEQLLSALLEMNNLYGNNHEKFEKELNNFISGAQVNNQTETVRQFEIYLAAFKKMPKGSDPNAYFNQIIENKL